MNNVEIIHDYGSPITYIQVQELDCTKEARVKNRDRRDETCEISCRIYSMKYDCKVNE